MSRKTRRIGALLAPGAALALWLVLGGLLLRSTLTPEQDGALSGALGSAAGPLIGVGLVWWLVGSALGAWAMGRVHKLWTAPAARLTDSLRVMAENPDAPDPKPEGAPELQALTAAVSDLAGRRRALQQSLEARVREASAAVAHERDQLAALMAELQQSVVVCNLEGRILLYNGRARALTKRLSRSPGGAGGAELMGLGRSISGVVDPALIAHARDSVERRLARGEAAASARFMTAALGGRLLQANMAPVRPSGEGAAMTGFVLMLDDVTEDHAAHARRDQHLQDLIEADRAGLASIQAALDMLDYPDLEPEEREQFQQVIRDQAAAMGSSLERVARAAAQESQTRWPLQDMLGTDLLSAAARRLEAERPGTEIDAEEPPEGLWLSLDGFAMLEALAFLGGRLAESLKEPRLTLRLAQMEDRAGGRAHLDLLWRGEDPEGASGWPGEPMRGDSGESPREAAERQGGSLWLERDRTQETAFFRFLLPLASGAAQEEETLSSRPEYYDFDLFAASEASRRLDDLPLSQLTYTVFDTETTGLDPSGGDEILQMGAARIVNGKLLRGEVFDQLVDPRRDIPEAGIPIHGVTPEMVRGQPTIAEVLPAFHAFAADTVLVGHNVAFDMRFLALKEEATGLRFDHPVLDTLLLSSILHPEAESHALEAIAARLGVTITGRHTAAGDALATAEVFLKLYPLLQGKGIATLGQARAAAQESYYARLRY